MIPDNYFSTLSSIGINVLGYSLNNDSLFGASSFSQEYGSFILVNTSDTISEERQLFSLIHELGHLLFHKNEYLSIDHNPFYEKTTGNIKEKTVDAFAGYFLMPRDLVRNYISERNEKVSLYEMKHHFKVSLQALYMSLHNYNLISDEKYKSFWKNIDSHNSKREEPKPLPRRSFEDKNEKLISALREMYFNDEVSVNRISEVLEMTNQETRALVKSWGESCDEIEAFI